MNYLRTHGPQKPSDVARMPAETKDSVGHQYVISLFFALHYVIEIVLRSKHSELPQKLSSDTEKKSEGGEDGRFLHLGIVLSLD